jgi:hypothetical protein
MVLSLRFKAISSCLLDTSPAVQNQSIDSNFIEQLMKKQILDSQNMLSVFDLCATLNEP